MNDGILAPGAGRRLLLRIAKDAAIERSRLAGAAATLATVAGAQLLLTWLVKEWLEGPLTGGSFLPVRALLVKAAGATLLLAMAVVLVALPRCQRQPAPPRAPSRPGDAEDPGEPRARGEEPSGRRARLQGLLGRRQSLGVRRDAAQEARRGRPRRGRLDRRGVLRGVAPRPRGRRPGPVPRPRSRPPRTGRAEEGRRRAEGAGRAPRRLRRAALRPDDHSGLRRRGARGGAIRGDERDLPQERPRRRALVRGRPGLDLSRDGPRVPRGDRLGKPPRRGEGADAGRAPRVLPLRGEDGGAGPAPRRRPRDAPADARGGRAGLRGDRLRLPRTAGRSAPPAPRARGPRSRRRPLPPRSVPPAPRADRSEDRPGRDGRGRRGQRRREEHARGASRGLPLAGRRDPLARRRRRRRGRACATCGAP